MPNRQNSPVVMLGLQQALIISNNNKIVLERRNFSDPMTSESGVFDSDLGNSTRAYNQGIIAGLGYRYQRWEAAFRYEASNDLEKIELLNSPSKAFHLVVNYRLGGE